MSVHSQFGLFPFESPFSKNTFNGEVDPNTLIDQIDSYWSKENRAITGMLCKLASSHPKHMYLSLLSLFDRLHVAAPEEYNCLISSSLAVSLCGGDSFTKSIKDLLNQRCVENLGSSRWQIATGLFECVNDDDIPAIIENGAFSLLIDKAIKTHQDSFVDSTGAPFPQRIDIQNKYEDLFYYICESSPYLYAEMLTHLQNYLLSSASQFEKNGRLADSVARLFVTFSSLGKDSRQDVIDGLIDLAIKHDRVVASAVGRICRRIEEAFGHESDYLSRFQELLSSPELSFKEKRRIAQSLAEFALYNPYNAEEMLSYFVSNINEGATLEELCIYAGGADHILSCYAHLLDPFIESGGFSKLISSLNQDVQSLLIDKDTIRYRELIDLVSGFYLRCKTESGIEVASKQLLDHEWINSSFPLNLIEDVSMRDPRLSRGILRGMLSVMEERGFSIDALQQFQDVFLISFESNPLLQQDLVRICVVMSSCIVDPTSSDPLLCIASEILEKARESREFLDEVCSLSSGEDENLP